MRGIRSAVKSGETGLVEHVSLDIADVKTWRSIGDSGLVADKSLNTGS
jgi:hypothetical protein